MKIGLMGLGDKRHIMYTLIRVLGEVGRTVIFTPNSQYLMLSEDRLQDFEINDVQVVVYTCDIDDLGEEYDLNSYSYIVYDIHAELPFELDVALMIDSRDDYVLALEDRSLEDIPLYTSCAMMKDDVLPREKAVKLPPASMVEPILQKMFETRQILPVNNSTFVKNMVTIVGHITELPASQVLPRLKKGVMNV